jgi:hypothetical protein
MGGNDRGAVQTAFENGRLVEKAPSTGQPAEGHRGDRIEPGEASGFTVEAKPGALEVNRALAETVDSHGHPLEFGSRARAEAYARQLSAEDGDLRLQAAAPNDPSDVDGYLLAAHNPSIKEPAETEGDTWTFDVGANLYGALGEAILLESQAACALLLRSAGSGPRRR